MDKIVRDGKVAVLVSPGFGSGWVTWNDGVSPFEPELVLALLGENGMDPREVAERLYPDAHVGSGFNNLTVEWVDEGVAFRYHEYDGSESLQFRDQIGWHTA